MNVEEIKQTYTMPEIMARYSIKVDRNGFCKCPFHNEKTASMKVNDRLAFCFGCGWGGDVIKFVQSYENIDFKEAFYKLGGTYHHENEQARKAAKMRFLREKQRKEREEKAERDFKKELSFCIAACRIIIDGLEPFSDLWCTCQNIYPCLVGAWEEKYINGLEVNEIDVLRKCREVRRGIDSLRGGNG